MNTVKYRVSGVSLGFLIALAVVFDALQIFLTLTVFGAIFTVLVTFIAAVIFFLSFAILGVSYFSGRKPGLKIATIFTSSVLELVPILSAFPTVTIGVLGIALISRHEDRLAAKEHPQGTG
jgi:hypothetical protein